MTKDPNNDAHIDEESWLPSNDKGAAAKWWVLVAIGIGTFMTAMDGSIVNTILPVVNRSFGASVAAVEWIVTIYLLVISGLLLSFGRLGDLKGHKAVYLSGFAVFLGSSAMCGLANSVTTLVIFRGCQALGGAMLAANSPAILTKSFPASQRGQALGMQATMTYLGLTVGPSLGGWLAEQLSWRAVFYINMPVGLAALALSMRFISNDRTVRTEERFDLLGAVVFMVGLVALLFGLNQGYNLGWTSLPILGSLTAAALLLVFFIFIELPADQSSTEHERGNPQRWRPKSPMLDLRLFTSRIFSASVLAAVLNYICVYSILFLMPFYLIQGRALSSAQAGIVLTSMPVVMAIVAPFSGVISDRIGVRLPSVAGMAFLAVGLFLLSQLGPASSLQQVAISMGIAGLGTGIFISPNNSALMGSAPRYRQGIAAGILATARNVGMVLGVGLTGAIFTTALGHQGSNTSAATLQASSGFGVALFDATHVSFLVAAGIAILGTTVSSTRTTSNNT
jgi:EmrB/QacA subfamily drug resistance transporter